MKIGDRFIEDTFNEIWEVVEVGIYNMDTGDKAAPEDPAADVQPGVKAIVVGYQVGNQKAPSREEQDPDLFFGNLSSPLASYGQPFIRVG